MWSQWVQLPPQGWVLVQRHGWRGCSTLYGLNCFVIFWSPWLLVKTIKTLTANKLVLKSCSSGPKVFTLSHSFVWNQLESYKRFCFASAFEWILACLAWSCISIILDLLDGSLAKISRAFYVSREFNEVNHVPTMPELSQLTIQSLVARIIPLFWCLRLSRAASTWKTRTLRRSSSIVWKRHPSPKKMKDDDGVNWRRTTKWDDGIFSAPSFQHISSYFNDFDQ